jgi:hypothetical protein
MLRHTVVVEQDTVGIIELIDDASRSGGDQHGAVIIVITDVRGGFWRQVA